MREVKGRTMLVVGLGGIGSEVAQRAHALGMSVIATRNSGTAGPAYVAEVGCPTSCCRSPDAPTSSSARCR